MGTILTLLQYPYQFLHLPFSSSRGSGWIVTRRGQPFSISATRHDFVRAMYRRA